MMFRFSFPCGSSFRKTRAKALVSAGFIQPDTGDAPPMFSLSFERQEHRDHINFIKNQQLKYFIGFCSNFVLVRTKQDQYGFFRQIEEDTAMMKLLENPNRLNELCSTVAVVGSTGFFLFVIGLGMAQTLRGLI